MQTYSQLVYILNSFEQLPKDDPKRRKPNISVANKKLHWKPNVGLELGLKKTIEFFKNE